MNCKKKHNAWRDLKAQCTTLEQKAVYNRARRLAEPAREGMTRDERNYISGKHVGVLQLASYIVRKLGKGK